MKQRVSTRPLKTASEHLVDRVGSWPATRSRQMMRQGNEVAKALETWRAQARMRNCDALFRSPSPESCQQKSTRDDCSIQTQQTQQRCADKRAAEPLVASQGTPRVRVLRSADAYFSTPYTTAPRVRTVHDEQALHYPCASQTPQPPISITAASSSSTNTFSSANIATGCEDAEHVALPPQCISDDSLHPNSDGVQSFTPPLTPDASSHTFRRGSENNNAMNGVSDAIARDCSPPRLLHERHCVRRAPPPLQRAQPLPIRSRPRASGSKRRRIQRFVSLDSTDEHDEAQHGTGAANVDTDERQTPKEETKCSHYGVEEGSRALAARHCRRTAAQEIRNELTREASEARIARAARTTSSSFRETSNDDNTHDALGGLCDEGQSASGSRGIERDDIFSISGRSNSSRTHRANLRSRFLP